MENTLIISVVKPAAMMVISIVTAQSPIPRPTAKIATKMIAVKTTVIVIVIAITTVIATRIIAENRQNPFRHCRPLIKPHLRCQACGSSLVVPALYCLRSLPRPF
nr:hypothetical protein [Anaerospora sp.]